MRRTTSIKTSEIDMSRGYPKFFYSKVENAVDNGHFVIRTVFPKGLFKVGKEDNQMIIEDLAIWEPAEKISEEIILLAKIQLDKWLKSQRQIVW